MCSHKPVLLAEAALLQAQSQGTPGRSAGSSYGAHVGASRNGEIGGGRGGGTGRREGAGVAFADLYGPGNKYRLCVREPSKMVAELRARERERAEKVRRRRRRAGRR